MTDDAGTATADATTILVAQRLTTVAAPRSRKTTPSMRPGVSPMVTTMVVRRLWAGAQKKRTRNAGGNPSIGRARSPV